MKTTKAGQQQQHHSRGSSVSGTSLLQPGTAGSLRRRIVCFFTAYILLTTLLAVTALYLGSGFAVEKSAVLTGRGSFFLIIIFITLVTLLIGGLLFFLHTVITPLENIRFALQRMTEGHLDTPVSVRGQDEVGQVGELVNDLSINMQEILLYIWNYTQHHFSLLEQVSKECSKSVNTGSNKSGFIRDIALMQRNAEELQAIVVAHDYFEVKLEHKKMVSDPQPEQAN